jgi:IS5 family transposase
MFKSIDFIDTSREHPLYLYGMIKKNNTISFADLGVEHRIIKVDLFERVNQLVDWESIEKEILKHYIKGQSVDGRESYSGLILFKMLLLQSWYGLSDEVVEEQIKDRISFSKFCLISMDEKVPDSTVLCRFRGCLAKANAFEALLNIINQRLIDGKVMLVKGIIVDASLTDTLRKPRGKKEYEVVEDRKEGEAATTKVVVKIQSHVDTEAAWIKKAGKLHYAYKQHVATNQEGFVLGIHTTAGNESDIKNLGSTLDKIKIAPRTPVYADKGYASAENDTILIEKKLKNRILNKAVKNKPLTEIEKQINKVISQTRYKIERTFGSIHKWFKAGIARYVGKIKMHAQHLMQAICYNLKRMPVIDIA